ESGAGARDEWNAVHGPERFGAKAGRSRRSSRIDWARERDGSAGALGRILAATDGRLNQAEASSMTPLFNPESGALFDLSSRVKLRISGADALRFLNGQITNDLRKATSASAIQASVLNAK